VICTPFDLDLMGSQLAKLIAYMVLLNVLLTVFAISTWRGFVDWLAERAERGAK
jgi:hypothetical protein